MAIALDLFKLGSHAQLAAVLLERRISRVQEVVLAAGRVDLGQIGLFVDQFAQTM